jgi:hypothetical protein
MGQDPDLGLNSEWRLRTSASRVRLAIRTSRPYLSATNVRLEHIRILDHACEQHQRTVAHARVMRLGRLFARRTATRNVNGRRATWPSGRCSGRDTASRAAVTFHARRRSWGSDALRRFNPMRAGERAFPFAPNPACALATAIHFPTVFVGRPSVPVTCWTRRSRDGWLRFRDPALAPDVWSAVELKINSAAILPWALRLRAPSGREMCLS